MRSREGLEGMRLHLLEAMRRSGRRLVQRVIIEGPLTDSEVRRGKVLAAERGWSDAVRRVRRS